MAIEDHTDPELDQWLAGLAGKRADAGASSQIGQRLRAHLTEQHAQLEAELAPATVQADKERLLFQARRQLGGKRRAMLFRVSPALAAGVAVLFVGGMLGQYVYETNYAVGLVDSYGELERERGVKLAQRVETPAPLRTARSLAEGLETAGIAFELNRTPERELTLEITVLGPSQLAALRQLFSEWGLAFPVEGYYYIDIKEPSGN